MTCEAAAFAVEGWLVWLDCVCSSANSISTISFRLQLREEDHGADAFLTQEHHAQPVDVNADAARRGHAVFEGDEAIFVELLPVAAGLVLHSFALLDGIVLLGVAGRDC